MQRTLTGSNRAILDLAREVAGLGESLGFDRTRCYEVQTAVGEALTNAARHGHGGNEADPIELGARTGDGRLLVEVHDRGPGLRDIPPLPDREKKIRGEERPGGWGVFLMRSLASDVHFVVHASGGHTLRLRFDAKAPEKPVEPRITEILMDENEVTLTEKDDVRVIGLPVDVGAETEDSLLPTMEDSLEAAPRLVVIDCGRVETMNSAGVGLLFHVVRRGRESGVRVVIADIIAQPKLVVERVQLTRYAEIFPTVEEAIESVRS